MTPHWRGGTSTLTCLAKWCACVGIVVALLAPSSLASTPSLSHSLLSVSPHHPCVCHLPFHSTLFLFNPLPVFWACVWHCDVAFTLSLWLLMCLCCHLCPSFLGLMVPRFLHCLCAHAFLHCLCPHNNMAPFFCVLSGVLLKALLQFPLREGQNGLWCCLAQKVSHERG